MKLLEKIEQLNEIHRKIKNGETGSPEDFANYLHVSKRHFFNLIEEFKEMGAPVGYNKIRQTYYYLSDFEFNAACTFRVLSEDNNIAKR